MTTAEPLTAPTPPFVASCSSRSGFPSCSSRSASRCSWSLLPQVPATIAVHWNARRRGGRLRTGVDAAARDRSPFGLGIPLLIALDVAAGTPPRRTGRDLPADGRDRRGALGARRRWRSPGPSSMQAGARRCADAPSDLARPRRRAGRRGCGRRCGRVVRRSPREECDAMPQPGPATPLALAAERARRVGAHHDHDARAPRSAIVAAVLAVAVAAVVGVADRRAPTASRGCSPASRSCSWSSRPPRSRSTSASTTAGCTSTRCSASRDSTCRSPTSSPAARVDVEPDGGVRRLGAAPRRPAGASAWCCAPARRSRCSAATAGGSS